MVQRILRSMCFGASPRNTPSWVGGTEISDWQAAHGYPFSCPQLRAHLFLWSNLNPTESNRILPTEGLDSVPQFGKTLKYYLNSWALCGLVWGAEASAPTILNLDFSFHQSCSLHFFPSMVPKCPLLFAVPCIHISFSVFIDSKLNLEDLVLEVI